MAGGWKIGGSTAELADGGLGVRIERINGDPEIARLLPEWTGLWRRVPDATPFQSPSWLMAWWRHFGTGAPHILTGRIGGMLVGVLPLYELHQSQGVKLLPLGISVSDYIDALVDPAYRDLADLMLAAITDIPDWQECHLPDLPPDAALAGAALLAGLLETRDDGPPCPVLALPASIDELAGIVPRKTLRDLRQARVRAAAAGPVIVEAADTRTLDGAMDDFFRLHERRWQSRSEQGVLAESVVRAFHRDAARGLSEAGLLRLYRLWIGDAVAAVYYGFCCNGKAYAYLGGFDPDQPRLSPGAQILHHAICEAIAEGATEFHFLRGGESYKYAWGAVNRWNLARTLTRR